MDTLVKIRNVLRVLKAVKSVPRWPNAQAVGIQPLLSLVELASANLET